MEQTQSRVSMEEAHDPYAQELSGNQQSAEALQQLIATPNSPRSTTTTQLMDLDQIADAPDSASNRTPIILQHDREVEPVDASATTTISIDGIEIHELTDDGSLDMQKENHFPQGADGIQATVPVAPGACWVRCDKCQKSRRKPVHALRKTNEYPRENGGWDCTKVWWNDRYNSCSAPQEYEPDDIKWQDLPKDFVVGDETKRIFYSKLSGHLSESSPNNEPLPFPFCGGRPGTLFAKIVYATWMCLHHRFLLSLAHVAFIWTNHPILLLVYADWDSTTSIHIRMTVLVDLHYLYKFYDCLPEKNLAQVTICSAFTIVIHMLGLFTNWVNCCLG